MKTCKFCVTWSQLYTPCAVPGWASHPPRRPSKWGRKWRKFLRKNERNQRKMRKDWGNVLILPTQEWETNYDPVRVIIFWQFNWQNCLDKDKSLIKVCFGSAHQDDILRYSLANSATAFFILACSRSPLHHIRTGSEFMHLLLYRFELLSLFFLII